jgi:hypothetical protein
MNLTLAAALLLPGLAGCGDSTGPDGIDIDIVVGTYSLTTLRFDPQGSLPDIDVLPALATSGTQLILTSNGAMQIVHQDPTTGLFVTIQGTFKTSPDGVRLDFAENSQYAEMLLTRRMAFTHNAAAGTLVFDDDTDGVSRTRLIALVPALATEQLLDPTPGRLRLTFTRA